MKILAVQLAEGFDVLQTQIVPEQVEHGVLQSTGMAIRQHKPITPHLIQYIYLSISMCVEIPIWCLSGQSA